jgi:hypothetical protein
MFKTARSPVRGYNHNVKYRGRVFHVQTEESGPANPRIATHLYFGGTILASKRAEYDPAAPPEIVRALMQSQHKSILKDLKAGRHDASLIQFFSARGEVLDPVAPSNASIEDDFPEDAVSQTPQPIVISDDAPVVPRVAPAVAAVTRPAAAIVASAVTFAENFDDEPTNPKESQETEAQRMANLAARAAKGTPALGSTVVRIERVMGIGEKTPGPVAAARVRKPAQAFPYVVQEGSHPVQNESEGPAVTAAASPAASQTAPMITVPKAAPPVVQVDGHQSAPAPMIATAETPAPLLQVNGAPVTAAEIGATPEVPVSREDNQTLDEVIMAYLSRGVDRDAGNAG